LFQSLWKACGIFEVFLREAAQRPPGRLPISGAYIVSCWKRAICRRTIVSTLRSRLPRKSRQPLRFAQIAVNSCSARRPRRRDFGRSNQPFFRTQIAAAIADTELENSGIAAASTPRQRMRFSAEPAKGCGSRRVNWIGRQTDKRPRIIEASQNWVGNSTSRRNQYHAAVQWKSSYPSWELIALFLRQKRRGRSEWKTRDLRA